MEKLMMSRPCARSRAAFCATSMMALGRARPMRRASWGFADTSGLLLGRLETADFTTRAMPASGGRHPRHGRSGRQDPVPFGNAVGPGRQRRLGVALDLHRLDGV